MNKLTEESGVKYRYMSKTAILSSGLLSINFIRNSLEAYV